MGILRTFSFAGKKMEGEREEAWSLLEEREKEMFDLRELVEEGEKKVAMAAEVGKGLLLKNESLSADNQKLRTSVKELEATNVELRVIF